MKLPIGYELQNKKTNKVYTIENIYTIKVNDKVIVNRSYWPWPNTPIPDNPKVEDALGEGGFGITYLASSRVSVNGVQQTHWFAIKEFFDKSNCQRDADGHTVIFNSPNNQQGIADFIREARRLKDEFRHDNVVKVVDVFQSNGTAYYVMEFLEGGSLENRVNPKEGEIRPMSEAEAINLMQPLLEAVEYLHSKNFMHCDIKPNNIVLHNNEPVLIDFGESLHFDNNGHLTSPLSANNGTPGYCPPEQYMGIDNFEPTCDVYALGATFFFLVTGTHPKHCKNIKKSDLIDGLQSHGVSEVFSDAIIHAMELNKQTRTPSVAALMQELGTRPMPDTLPIGYHLICGADDYEIIENGKIGTRYIEYNVYRLPKDEQRGVTAPIRYKLYEFYVKGATSRDRKYNVQQVNQHSSEFAEFLQAENKRKSYPGFSRFEANGTMYFVHHRQVIGRPSFNVWKRVGYVAGVIALAYGFYFAINKIDWEPVLSTLKDTATLSDSIAYQHEEEITEFTNSVENMEFDIMVKVPNSVPDEYRNTLREQGLLRFSYTGEVTEDSIPNGYGKAVFANGDIYEGLFECGIGKETDKNAVYTFTKDSLKYKGVTHYFVFKGDSEGQYIEIKK